MTRIHWRNFKVTLRPKKIILTLLIYIFKGSLAAASSYLLINSQLYEKGDGNENENEGVAAHPHERSWLTILHFLNLTNFLMRIIFSEKFLLKYTSLITKYFFLLFPILTFKFIISMVISRFLLILLMDLYSCF